MADDQRRDDSTTYGVRVALAVLVVAAAGLILVPFWPWLVLAVWVGVLGRRLVPPLTRLTGRRQRAAALVTVALISSVVVPAALLVGAIVVDAIALVERLLRSEEARGVFEALVSGSPGGSDREALSPIDLLVSHGGRAWTVLRVIASAATQAVLGLVVFVTCTYVVLADGPVTYAWIERHAPVPPAVLRRFAAAFMETGRGLLIGVGGAGVAQAVLATGFYVAIGVPQPLVLGLLTLIASLVPAIGTAFVWGPVAIGLAMTGRSDAAVAMGLFGVLVIGSVDNLARPWLARRAKLELPAWVIMVGMFGGISLVGPEGLLLGPIVLRLAKEALVIAREERERHPG